MSFEKLKDINVREVIPQDPEHYYLTLGSAFHNVGHGLFYSGQIRVKPINLKKNVFDFIYDCGSKKGELIDKALDDYFDSTDLVDNKLINLLIISHFHKDHVNGLPKLFRKRKIDTVVLPYLTPIERLLIFSKYEELDNNYAFFLTDPVAYFYEFNPDIKIILIGNGGDRSDFSSEPPINDTPPGPDDFSFLMNIKGKPSKSLQEEIFMKDPQWQSIDRNKQRIYDHKVYMIAGNLWYFKFFNLPISDDTLYAFKQELARVFNKGEIENFDFIKQSEIQVIIQDSNNHSDLKKCYEKISSVNNTSLVVFHAPRFQNNLLNWWNTFCKNEIFLRCSCPFYFRTPFMGTLLSGDIGLKLGSNFKLFADHYSECLGKIHLFQVPHHGSSDNWNYDILSSTRNCICWIISAKSDDDKHPSIEVVKDLINNNKTIYIADENIKVVFYSQCQLQKIN